MDWRTHSQRNDWILMSNLNSRPTNKTSATFVCPMCLKFYVLFLHNSNYFSDYTMKAEPHHEHTISNEPRDDLIWRYDNNHHSTLILERRHISRVSNRKVWKCDDTRTVTGAQFVDLHLNWNIHWVGTHAQQYIGFISAFGLIFWYVEIHPNFFSVIFFNKTKGEKNYSSWFFHAIE